MVLGGFNFLTNGDFSAGLAGWDYTNGFTSTSPCVGFEATSHPPTITVNNTTLTPSQSIEVQTSESVTGVWLYDIELPVGCHRVEVEIGGETYQSQYIEVVPSLKCRKDLIKIEWKSDCDFAAIPYSVLPTLTNFMYVEGGVSRTSLSKKSREQFTNGVGVFSTYYNHSVAKSEVRIGAYTEAIHEVLERAFEHKYLFIDGKRYLLDDDSNYTIASTGGGRFTARIDMIKGGTELITSDCCC